MGELGEVVPPLKISPRRPAATGRRAGDPGRWQPEPRAGRRTGDKLPAITRRRRPSLPAAVRGTLPPVRSHQRWLPSLVLALGLATGWMATPADATSPAPRVEARAGVVMDAATGAVL